jgi:CubicO group peptidase (beta-lactamase class C family)
MAGANHRGLCGGHDRPVRDPRTPAADRPGGHAVGKPVLGLLGAALLALATAAPLAAQQSAAPPDSRTLAQAAGWKALFLCSGRFVAGMAEADIAANDLQGGYPELQPHLAGLTARIDPAKRLVEVPFPGGLPPRVARYTPGSGCALLPVGGDPARIPPPPELVGGPDRKALDAQRWPLGDAQATATLAGDRARRVEAVVAEALRGGRYGSSARTSAVLVVADGRIVAERYARGVGVHTPQRTWSVAKSLTSALVGRAAALGVLDPLAPAHVPEWEAAGDPRAAIPVDALLRMQSGLDTSGAGNRTDALYFGGSTVAETAAVAPLEVPTASRFRYANNDTLLAARALMTDLGEAAPSFAYTHLLWPLGMTRTTIEGDWRGAPVLSSQVWMTARDLARLALLHLNDGVWNGARLLPEGWVRDATTPQGPQPPAERGEGYGRAIWLLGAAKGLPEGTYAFYGNRGQLAIVVPSARLVVVRRGFDPAGTGFDGAALTRDLLAALN